MTRPPQGTKPGADRSPDESMTDQLPFDEPRVDSIPTESLAVDKSSISMTSSAATEAASAKEPAAPTSVENSNSLSISKPPESLASIAASDMARDPFAYYAMPRVQADRSAPDRTVRERLPDPPLSSQIREERDNTGYQHRGLSASRHHDDLSDGGDTSFAGSMMPSSRFSAIRDRDPSLDQAPERGARDERMQRPTFDRPRVSPSFEAPSQSEHLRERARPDTTFEDARGRLPTSRDSFQRPMRRPTGFERFGPMDDDAQLSASPRLQRDNFRPPVEDEAPVPVDIRVTRAPIGTPTPRMDDRRQIQQDRFENLSISTRSDPRFDSASDEAVSFVDQNVPPLRVTEFEERNLYAQDDAQSFNFDSENHQQHDGLDELTSRLRDRAINLTERMNAPRGDAVLDQAKHAIAFFRGKVDEVRVARAEARYKAAEAAIEPQADDDLYDSHFDAPQLEQEELRPTGPISSFKASLADRFVFTKRAPVRTAPNVHRAVRHRRQSRLYEDIVAWIVVPPFIVGAIYGVLELAKYIANSPIGKMLSGQ